MGIEMNILERAKVGIHFNYILYTFYISYLTYTYYVAYLHCISVYAGISCTHWWGADSEASMEVLMPSTIARS